jgi:hypothetical protein
VKQSGKAKSSALSGRGLFWIPIGKVTWATRPSSGLSKDTHNPLGFTSISASLREESELQRVAVRALQLTVFVFVGPQN